MEDGGKAKNSEVLLFDGMGVSFERARTALWTSLQAVAAERDERIDLVDEARLLRKKINFLVRSLGSHPAVEGANVLRLPFECEGDRAVARALRTLLQRAECSEEGFVPVSAPVYWTEEFDESERLRCSARFVICRDGSIALLRTETCIIDATVEHPGTLDRCEWVGAKTLAGLLFFCKRGFSFNDFLDELLESASG